MASSSTPRKDHPTPPARRSYCAATKRPAGFKTNTELQAEMNKTAIDPAVMVKFQLERDLLPCDVGLLIASYGLPLSSIRTMYSAEEGRVAVQMVNQQYAEMVKQKHRNNTNDGQASLRLIEAEDSKFVSVSRVTGDYSDEKVKELLFGEHASRVVSVHYERYKMNDGQLTWLTGRRFYNFLLEDFEKLPDLPPFIQLDERNRSYVRVQGKKRQCLRCKSEGHLVADCPLPDRRNTIVEEEDEGDDDDTSGDDDTKKEDDTGLQDLSSIADELDQRLQSSDVEDPVPKPSHLTPKKRKYPTAPVKQPAHWKDPIQNNPNLDKKIKAQWRKNKELTPEMIRNVASSTFLQSLSPNLALLSDDPDAAEFDPDEIFRPPSNSLIINNNFNTTY